MSPMTTTIQQALANRSEAERLLGKLLRSLEGEERKSALLACREAGLGASELASLLGVSRARVYQLTDIRGETR